MFPSITDITDYKINPILQYICDLFDYNKVHSKYLSRKKMSLTSSHDVRGTQLLLPPEYTWLSAQAFCQPPILLGSSGLKKSLARMSRKVVGRQTQQTP